MLATSFAAENLMQVALREHRSQTGDGRADDQVEEDMLAVAIRLSLAEAAAPSVDSDCMLTTWPRSSQQPPQPAWVISRAAQPFHVLIRHTNMSHMAMRRWQSILLPHLIGGGVTAGTSEPQAQPHQSHHLHEGARQTHAAVEVLPIKTNADAAREPNGDAFTASVLRDVCLC